MPAEIHEDAEYIQRLLVVRPVGNALALILTGWLLVAGQPVTAEQNATPAHVAALKNQISDIDEWLEEAEEDRSELEQELVATERSINELTRERRSLETRARQQKAKLDELQVQESELVSTLDRQRESLKKQIRAAWMEGDAPAVKVLLNEIDPQTISRTMTYYEYLSRDAIQRLKDFNATLEKLTLTQKNAQATQVELTQLQARATERETQLRDRKQQREKTLVALKSDISSRESERASLEADRSRLEKLLREVEVAIARIPSPNESQPFKALKAKLPWPARGKVNHKFGDSLAQGKLKYNGILITTGKETDVAAIHYGRVVFANWLRGFGLMTIVDHGDGFMSLYGHSSSLLKSPGDWVDAGETIAVAGRSGGTDAASVYFEIRFKGKPQNPQTWLKR